MGCRDKKPGCPETLLRYVAHGAKGLAKAAFGIDRPAKQVLTLRMNVCKQCPFLTAKLFCEKCGCLIVAKARIFAEDCPEGKWPKLSPQHQPKVAPVTLRGMGDSAIIVPRQTGPRS